MILRFFALACLATIFARAATLHISPGAYSSGKVYVPVVFDGAMAIPIALAATEVHALWDTGSALTFVDQDFIAAHREDFRPTKKYMNGVDGAGHNLLLQVFRAKKIVVAGAVFEDVRVVAGNRS